MRGGAEEAEGAEGAEEAEEAEGAADAGIELKHLPLLPPLLHPPPVPASPLKRYFPAAR